MDNMDYYSRRFDTPVVSDFLHKKGLLAGLPVAGNFEITPRCNFNCKMCYVHQQCAEKDELSAKDWIELGREACENGMVFLLLTGGEPFLRKDFTEIYLGLRKLGLVVSVNTNASLLTDEILEAFRQSPPAKVNVTLYGGSNNTYQKLCGVASYDRVTENILRMKAIGVNVRINATITPYNVSDIDDIFTFGKDNGFPVRATSYIYPPVRSDCTSHTYSRFTPQEAAECMLKFREQYLSPEQLKDFVKPPLEIDEDCNGEGGPMRCRAGRTSFWITWDGRMLPCGMFPGEGYSVYGLGFGSAWIKIRNDVNQIYMPAECSACNKRDKCGVCAANCFAENGDTKNPPEYLCEMMDALDKLICDKYG